jgi:hypothetical protein
MLSQLALGAKIRGADRRNTETAGRQRDKRATR